MLCLKLELVGGRCIHRTRLPSQFSNNFNNFLCLALFAFEVTTTKVLNFEACGKTLLLKKQRFLTGKVAKVKLDQVYCSIGHPISLYFLLPLNAWTSGQIHMQMATNKGVPSISFSWAWLLLSWTWGHRFDRGYKSFYPLWIDSLSDSMPDRNSISPVNQGFKSAKYPNMTVILANSWMRWIIWINEY